MKSVAYIKPAVWISCFAFAASMGAQATTYPTLLYGTTTQVAPANPFAVGTTVPTLDAPRSKYVVVAESNASTNLEVLAWHDTSSSLVATPVSGISDKKGVAAVAVAGLDSSRVVTADVNTSGQLAIHTWVVGAEGVVQQNFYRGASSTAAANVSITTLSAEEVAVAYETPAGRVTVEAFTIGHDGKPSPHGLLATGPSAFQVAIATLNSHQVITAAADAGQSLWTNTWEINSTGVHAQAQKETRNAVTGPGFKSNAVQNVAVGAGQSLEKIGTPATLQVVASAFTPVITPDNQVQVYYWTVSPSGAITLSSTAPPTLPGDFNGVAAAMLANNTAITSYFGGTGDNHVFNEVYTGLNPYMDSPPQYGNPYNAVSISTAAEGTNLNHLCLFAPYAAFFVSSGQFGDGTVYINVFSYPEPASL